MRLSELIRTLKINACDFPDKEITGVTCSTDKVIPGSLFAAIRGTMADGHDFIRLAAEKGAAAVIGDRGAAETDSRGLAYIQTENAEKAYAEACAAFFGHPERKIQIVGVTGTNGKTTVTNMLRSIAIASGRGCGLIGTVETIAGGRARPASMTTPPAEELFALLAEMASSGDCCCVMEVSSHALARGRVHGIIFDVGVMTNVTRDHLDYHKTMEAYAAAKASLMEQSRAAVVNADDPWAPLFTGKAPRTVTYGIDGPADVRAEDIEFTPEHIRFNSPFGAVTLPAGGRFSVYNALAAMTAAREIGIGENAVRCGAELFSGVKGRMELLKTKGKYRVYIDYAHTPDGLENVLKALRSFATGRIITVFGCGGDRDRTKRPIMGEIASRLSDFAVLTSDNPRTEDPEAIIADVEKGMSGPHAAVTDRKEAIRLALHEAREGDIVLLAGKGHETYQIVGRERLHMDERELVREIEEE